MATRHYEENICCMRCLRVSGMSSNNLLLQILADNIGIPVLRPSMPETSALGAAIMGKNATLSSHFAMILKYVLFIPLLHTAN